MPEGLENRAPKASSIVAWAGCLKLSSKCLNIEDLKIKDSLKACSKWTKVKGLERLSNCHHFVEGV